MKYLFISQIMLACVLATGCQSTTSCQKERGGEMSWRGEMDRLVPLFGHRNWIMVVDKAFPLQSAPGVTVVDTRSNLPQVLSYVMTTLNAATHVKPIVYTDQEMAYITEALAPGIEKVRAEIQTVLANAEVQTLPHEAVFKKLDEASRLFQVMVLKTDCTLPYTSVFIELDCGYWDAAKEKQLRESMKSEKNK